MIVNLPPCSARPASQVDPLIPRGKQKCNRDVLRWKWPLRFDAFGKAPLHVYDAALALKGPWVIGEIKKISANHPERSCEKGSPILVDDDTCQNSFTPACDIHNFPCSYLTQAFCKHISLSSFPGAHHAVPPGSYRSSARLYF